MYTQKHPLTYGPAHLILESKSPLLIIIGTTTTSNSVTSKFMKMAQEISHSWYLYGNGNAVIIYDTEFIGGQYVKGNLILLGSIFENKVTEMVMGERNSEGISSFSKP